MKNFVFAFIILIAGCTSTELPENWGPLIGIKERPSLPGVSDTVVTTISPYIYVADIDWFWETYPEGSFEFESLRRHEIQHALEQEAYIGGATGLIRLSRLSSWLRQYTMDPNFRWEVEKRGYEQDLLYAKSKGRFVAPETMAAILSGESYNNMVSYEEALEWVKSILYD